MSYNGSGVYTLPGAALANGDIVSATENNQFRNDVAAALNIAWTRDGQAPATANIPMGSHKLTGLAAGTGAGDSVRYEQLPGASNLLPVAFGGTGSGTASGARTNLGVAIGTDVQAYAAELQGATQGGINGMKNRIINGAMMIDQRNAGASVNTNSGATVYTLDRWQAQYEATSKFTVQQSSIAPAGFVNSLLVTSSSAYSPTSTQWFAIAQSIEGLNIADFGWGTANAQPITVSFWVRSSLTGTFGGSVTNASWGRSYPFSYTISAANTWEQKSVTIAGDTTGTWNTNTSTGLTLRFSLGTGSSISNTAGSWYGSQVFAPTGAVSVVGTNGATFYITGVQLEKGSTATSFDYRPYGTELFLCERYARLMGDGMMGVGGSTGANIFFSGFFESPMRASPTGSLTKTAISVSDEVSADFTSSGSAINDSTYSSTGFRVSINGFSGLTSYRSYPAKGNGSFLLLSAEL